jgi:DNA modification methylase
MKTVNEGYEEVPLNRLKLHPRNVNQGDYGAISESIEANGFFGAVTANKRTGHILAGNHRYKVAKEQHAATIPVIWVDVDKDAELRILLADNRTARLGQDDENALAALLSELAVTDIGLSGTGFDCDDLDAIIGRLAVSNLSESQDAELLTDADEVPDNAPRRCKDGDLWQLGPHRLLCGDAMNPDDLALLVAGMSVDMVFCDPPYGINIVATGSIGGDNIIPVGKYAPIIGDDTTGTAITAHVLASALYPKAVHIWWGGNYYASSLPPSSCWIVWDKQNTGNFADAELAWTNQPTTVRIFQHMWNGLMKASEKGEKRVHPTQKPVALAEWCIQKYGKPSGVMLDQFAGSGMSLIACEKKKWSWLGVEMSPDYCDVIIARWEKATGQAATLIEPAPVSAGNNSIENHHGDTRT